MLKPAELEFLLHSLIFPDPHPNVSAPTYVKAVEFFRTNGIIAAHDYPQDTYHVTPRGRAWIKRILAVPMPVEAWKDSEGKLIDTEA